MRSTWTSSLLWALAIAEGVGALSGVSIAVLGIPWRRSIGDVLFFEGAVLLVVAGLLDVGRSITVAHIRALPRIGEAPPSVRKPGRTIVLVIAGVLMCLQGALLVRLFPLSGG
jgi:hypothetical protein